MKKKIIGIDLFAGAGGMSLGAKMAGIDVKLAVEINKDAALTYKRNHPDTVLIVDDIANVSEEQVGDVKGDVKILFGGPPCQGFSSSNRRTRNHDNPRNWLFKQFIRITNLWEPDWIILENVKGIKELDRGAFLNSIVRGFRGLGYTCSSFVLSAADFGVPQERKRFFLIGSRSKIRAEKPAPSSGYKISVGDAIEDLPTLSNGADVDEVCYKNVAQSDYAKMMRGKLKKCTGHLVSKNSDLVVERYKYIPQGGNWEDIPDKYMQTYADKTRCHTGVYRRLFADRPSVVLGNYRKNMLVHPYEDRGLSVREAARLQSFPDWYVFCGTLGSKQQQVGNAVPPKLAEAVFRGVIK